MPILASADEKEYENVPTNEEKVILIRLVHNSTLWYDGKEEAFEKIERCNDYKDFEKLQFWLESIQMPFDQIVNPNMGDIKKHVRTLMDRE